MTLINEMIDAYKAMKEGTEFFGECKEQNITRDDLEKRVYPEMSNRFDAIGNKGQTMMKNKSAFKIFLYHRVVGSIHQIVNRKKINESWDYTKNYVLNECKLKK